MNSFLKVPLTATCLVATWLAVKVSRRSLRHLSLATAR